MKYLKIFEEFNIKDMMKRGYHSADVKKKKCSSEGDECAEGDEGDECAEGDEGYECAEGEEGNEEDEF